MFAPNVNIRFFHCLTVTSVAVFIGSGYYFINYKTDDWRLVVSVSGILLSVIGFVFGILMPDEVRYAHNMKDQSTR